LILFFNSAEAALVKVKTVILEGSTSSSSIKNKTRLVKLRVFPVPREQTGRDRSGRLIPAQGHFSRRLPQPARDENPRRPEAVDGKGQGPPTGGNEGNGLLRFWRHVFSQVSDDFHSHGRG